MTGEQEQARLMAERIARRVSASGSREADSARVQSSDGGGDDISAELSAMRAGLDDLRQKLVQIESRLSHHDGHAAKTSADAYDHPALRLSGMYVPTPHPSEERFGVEEATVAELVDYFEGAKKCDLEPGGKPCDHCAMCSSRGF
ncbi:MAG: hypothetical protein JOZ52_12480 [Acidobacteria bacterium]|nr:hypothetical protein [Acidobacteriota bacterium]